MQIESNIAGMYVLGPNTITNRDSKGRETIMKLADVVRVRSFALGGGGVMELTALDGHKLVVASSREMGRRSQKRLKEPARSQYREFAAELHRRLAASGSVKFVRGLIFKKPYDPMAIPETVLP
jgi:hypothetical protein